MNKWQSAITVTSTLIYKYNRHRSSVTYTIFADLWGKNVSQKTVTTTTKTATHQFHPNIAWKHLYFTSIIYVYTQSKSYC